MSYCTIIVQSSQSIAKQVYIAHVPLDNVLILSILCEYHHKSYIV